MNKDRPKKRQSRFGIYFLTVILLGHLILLFIRPGETRQSLLASAGLLSRIVPIVLVVIVFMGIMNFFLSSKTIARHVGTASGARGWLVASLAGILSHGPIYVWYPLLKDLRQRGMRTGLMAVFLYNRSIKIPLLPMMVYYFGIKFVVILLVFMVLASFAEGKAIEILEG